MCSVYAIALNRGLSVKQIIYYILPSSECSGGSYLCQHPPCGPQTAFSPARDAGAVPEDSFFLPKPPAAPESWGEIPGWQTEIQTLRGKKKVVPTFFFPPQIDPQ